MLLKGTNWGYIWTSYIGDCYPASNKESSQLMTSWWFQPLWKILYSQNGNLPQLVVKIKNTWNHHPDEYINPYYWVDDQSPAYSETMGVDGSTLPLDPENPWEKWPGTQMTPVLMGKNLFVGRFWNAPKIEDISRLRVHIYGYTPWK